MTILIILIAIIVFLGIAFFTSFLWEKPKDSVDMMAKFKTIVDHACNIGPDGKIIEVRENFIKAGTRNANGEKAFMVKQRPNNEFRVIYICYYDKVYHDLKFDHIYPDDYDQNKIIEEFEKEIKEKQTKRK